MNELVSTTDAGVVRLFDPDNADAWLEIDADTAVPVAWAT